MRKSFLLKSLDDHEQNHTDNINPVKDHRGWSKQSILHIIRKQVTIKEQNKQKIRNSINMIKYIGYDKKRGI